jgi:hypothetical protein
MRLQPRYFKIAVDDSRDRVIVKVIKMQGMMIAGKRVKLDGEQMGNQYCIFSPEDIKYEMCMDRVSGMLQQSTIPY